ncbi:MAG TPA: outer membrane protein assembly factor BamE [Nitrospiraceae bacterium]|jgi:outer membrane protein assembly factor BamE (lipoprotein component of BamABCDE complex)|nr:outer membrane protein assembly factor BamE [Nitrospiraceae bacterium]
MKSPFGPLALILLAAGCALFIPQETRYLQSAQDQATQEEVRQHLGTPALVTSTQGGEAVWVYEVYQKEPGSQQSWAAFGSWCDEYILTFDRQGILRNWTHKSEKHGGENLPTYCVTDGFKPHS